MEKVIMEVGSTVTKIDLCKDGVVKHLEDYVIEFKRHFKENNVLAEEDLRKLVSKVNEYIDKYEEVFVCGTSVFRMLDNEQKGQFLEFFKEETGLDFVIIDSNKENELTVVGAASGIDEKVAVFVGGGGSTEIAIYDNGIKEMVNSSVGVIDIMNLFSDLGDDLALTSVDVVKDEVKKRLRVPSDKVDYLILAGGGHLHFALLSGFRYEENKFFKDDKHPIMMDMATRIEDTYRYFSEISLEEIRSRVDDPDWWYATRAMTIFVLVVAEALQVKYIIPTDISMVYGLI